MSQVLSKFVATGLDAAKLADGSVSNTELEYLDGVTSDIQTQLNAKATITQTISNGNTTDAPSSDAVFDALALKMNSFQWGKESITLVAGDITNQYVDLAQTIKANSLMLVVGGVVQIEGVDYTINLTGGAGGVTRLTFAGGLATGGASELVATDILRISYTY